MAEEGKDSRAVADEGMELGLGEASKTMEEVKDSIGTSSAPRPKCSSSHLIGCQNLKYS